jgi:hypothetical protein
VDRVPDATRDMAPPSTARISVNSRNDPQKCFVVDADRMAAPAI